MIERRALIAMARHPEVGKVKTRIAATMGDQRACALYEAFLEDLEAGAGADSRWRFLWCFTPAEAPFGAARAPGAESFAQVGGDLGDRLRAAFVEAFRRDFDAVAVIGTDVPQLPAERVQEAFDRLAAGADLVLGPCPDGGYYLVAARKLPPVFEGIAWSTERVLEQTCERARVAGLEVALLEPETDLDTEADLEALCAEAAAGRLRSRPGRALELLSEFARELEGRR